MLRTRRTRPLWTITAPAPRLGGRRVRGRATAAASLSAGGGDAIRLAVHRGHRRGGIALAGGGALGGDRVDPGELVGGQRDVDGGDVLLEIAPPLGAGDRDDVVAARQDPGERQLAGGDGLVPRDGREVLDEREVLGEVVALEARREPAEVVGCEVLEL